MTVTDFLPADLCWCCCCRHCKTEFQRCQITILLYIPARAVQTTIWEPICIKSRVKHEDLLSCRRPFLGPPSEM